MRIKYFQKLDIASNDSNQIAFIPEMCIRDRLKAVVTQNIDGLHQAAGSRTVYELHGSIHRNYCQKCGKFFDAAYVKNADGVPKCDACGGMIKPDAVSYTHLDVYKRQVQRRRWGSPTAPERMERHKRPYPVRL